MDLWVDRPQERFDRAWDAAGLESRVASAKGRRGPRDGLDRVGFLPWSALAAKAPAGHGPAAAARRPLALQRLPDRAAGRPEPIPRRARSTCAWSPTGQHSFHVPEAFREIEFARAELRWLLELAPAPGAPAAATRRRRGRWAAPRRARLRPRALPSSRQRRAPRRSTRWTASTGCSATTARDSPLSRLNREAASGPVAVEPELVDFLDAVPALEPRVGRRLRRDGGAADEGVGLLPRRGPPARGGGDLARRSRSSATATCVLDRRAGTVRFDRPGVELDLGGIGKGYAVDRVVDAAAPPRRRLGARQPRRQQRLRPGRAAGSRGLGGRDPGPDRSRQDGRERGAARPGAERLGRLRALLREGRRHVLAHHGPADGPAGAGRAERRGR